MPELALGTAKIGLRTYGVGSTVVMDDCAILAVLDASADLDLIWVDTAQAYGDAEGRWTYDEMRIITKLLPQATCHPDHLARLVDSLHTASMDRIGAEPDVFLLHTESQIQDDAMVAALKSVGGRWWGISAYDPKWARLALAKGATAIEFPLHILNQQFLEVAAEAKAQGCLTIARSPFAGGALLREPATLAAEWQEPVRQVHALARVRDESVAHLCFRWAWTCPDIDVLVVGVSSAAQLRDVAFWSQYDHQDRASCEPFAACNLDRASLWAVPA